MHSSKLKLRIISIILFIIFSVCFTKKTLATDLPFYDDFESGISSNWQTISGVWTTAVDPNYPSRGKWLVANAPRASDYEIQTGNYFWTNYQLEFDILPKVGVDRNIFFRVNNLRTFILSGHNLPVSYSLQLTGGLSYLGKWTVGSMPPLPSSTYSIPFNNISHVIIKVDGSNIKVTVNGVQILDYTDTNSPILSGRISLAAITGSNASEVWYDNVLITDLVTPTATPTPIPTSTPTPTPTFTPTPTPSPTPSPIPTPIPLPFLNVTDIKQYDPSWANNVYDTATYWSSNPTIERWGCALTSAVMILKYYGYNVTPDSLNNWLKIQPDGYVRNGLLNWLAVSRYTKINSEGILFDLEYRRLGNTQDLLINELTNGRPVILQEPGHFIVAKSQTATSFGINDPAYSDRLTLASYGDVFGAIGSYLPTHTDLSYIMITADKDSSIAIFDSDGNPIDTVTTYLQEPLTDDFDNVNTSGETLKILLLPKPNLEKYSVQVDNGQNPFSLDAYAYDNDGNLLGGKPEKINATASLVFQLNYDSDPTTPLVDNTPPTITANITPAPNAAGWNNSNITVTWTLNDPESSIISKSGCDIITLNTETAGTLLTCTASSLGGTASKSVTVKLDKTAPKIIIKKPLNNAEYVLHANVMGSWSVTDFLSKLEGTESTKTSSKSLLNTNYVGKHTFTVNAKDSAGNLTTATLNYYVTYAFKFLSPKTIQRREFLTKPSIPVKFKLNNARGKFIPYAQTHVVIAETNTPLFGGVNLSGSEYEYSLLTRLLPFTKNSSLTLKFSFDDGSVHTQKITLK